MTTITKERVEELRGWLSKEYCHPENEPCDVCPKLREIGAILDDYSSLRAEAREWICESCNTVYPGPPRPGLACVICPKCEGPTMPKSLAENRKLKAENERLREDVDALAKTIGEQNATQLVLISRAEKAEAELMRAEDRHHIDLMELHAQEAELARQAPLIQAVMGAVVYESVDGKTRLRGDSEDAILRAALKLREGEGK